MTRRFYRFIISLAVILLLACEPSIAGNIPLTAARPGTIPTIQRFVPSPPAHGGSASAAEIGFPALDWIKMVDARTGWAITAQTERLVRTSNGGNTWQDVTPNLESMIAPSTFILDGQLIWTLSYDQERSAVVGANSILFHSADGGRTWTSSQAPFQGGLLAFEDAQNGWAFVVPPGSYASTATGILYQTHDAGQSWEQIVMNDPHGTVTSPPGGLSVFSGDDFAAGPGSRFWLRDHTRPDLPLWSSADGGQSWHSVRVKVSPLLPGTPFTASLPVFTSSLDGCFTLSATFSAEAAPQNLTVVFNTHDGGESWSASPNRLPGMVQIQPEFVSPQSGFLQAGDSLWATKDGGASWRDISAGLNASSMKDRQLIDFSFSDALDGWAIVADGFYQTRDGGLNWQPAHPALVP